MRKEFLIGDLFSYPTSCFARVIFLVFYCSPAQLRTHGDVAPVV